MPDVNAGEGDMEKLANVLASRADDLTRLKAAVGTMVYGQFGTRVSGRRFEDAYQEFSSGIARTIEGLNEMSQYLRRKAGNPGGRLTAR